MTNTDDTAQQEETDKTAEAISYKEFLENTHPSVLMPVRDFWNVRYPPGRGNCRGVETSDLRLHCSTCGGERTFRCPDEKYFSLNSDSASFTIEYKCGDCDDEIKLFSLHAIFDDENSGKLYKYGELPPFGVPISNRVLRLFGRDASLFRKGRQCENLGYGVAAFAYYRRVVENHKNDILDEIIKVCRTVGAPEAIVSELDQAKREVSFSKAIESMKSALPQGLLIDGHNPLLALHGALSVGLHDESDEDCLKAAHAVRLVLTDLVERIALLKQDNRQLSDAVQLLLRKKS